MRPTECLPNEMRYPKKRMPLFFTDLHMHLLPGLDDGSPSEESTLHMAAMAAESGTERIVATPHSRGFGDHDDPLFHLAVREASDALAHALEDCGIPLQILTGMEVFAGEDTVRELAEGILLPLGDTRCVLTEFSFDEDPDFVKKTLRDMQEAGWLPLIAHPERYYFIQDDLNLAFQLVKTGCLLQVNKGSLLGRFGETEQSCAVALVRHGLVHAVASDAHSPRRRTPPLDIVYTWLSEAFSPRTAELLLSQNPNRILSGELPIPVTEPFPFHH